MSGAGTFGVFSRFKQNHLFSASQRPHSKDLLAVFTAKDMNCFPFLCDCSLLSHILQQKTSRCSKLMSHTIRFMIRVKWYCCFPVASSLPLCTFRCSLLVCNLLQVSSKRINIRYLNNIKSRTTQLVGVHSLSVGKSLIFNLKKEIVVLIRAFHVLQN